MREDNVVALPSTAADQPAPAAPPAPEPEPAPAALPAPEPEPEPVAIVRTPPDPERPKRAGGGSKAKSVLSGS